MTLESYEEKVFWIFVYINDVKNLREIYLKNSKREASLRKYLDLKI